MVTTGTDEVSWLVGVRPGHCSCEAEVQAWTEVAKPCVCIARTDAALAGEALSNRRHHPHTAKAGAKADMRMLPDMWNQVTWCVCKGSLHFTMRAVQRLCDLIEE